MSGFRRWGVSALTMVSVATVVLFVTGWGQAIASSVTSVIVKNPPANPVNVRETGTVAVSVSNPPPAPTTQVVVDTSGSASGLPVGGQNIYTPVSHTTDLSAYRSVTLYLDVSLGASSGQQCDIQTWDPAGNAYLVGTLSTGSSLGASKTLDPAPPNVEVVCSNDTGVPVTWNFMLAGRTG